MRIDRCWGTLNTRPRTDLAVPSNNRVSNERIVSDLSILQDNRLLNSDTCTNSGAWADRHILSKLSGWVDVCGWVDEHWWKDVRGWLSKLLRAVVHCLLEIKCVSRDGRSSSLNLAPKVLSLVDKELLRIRHIGEDILLETEDFVLLVLVISEEAGLQVLRRWVGVQAWAVGAALDGAADGWKDGVGAEEVDAAVDQVGDVRLWLLDVVQHTAGVWIGNNASKVAGSIFTDTGTENDGLGIALLEELEHVHEWEGAADVGVENEEALGLALQDGIAEVVEATCSAKSLILAEVFDGELGELEIGRASCRERVF